jgi:uncharacterized protein
MEGEREPAIDALRGLCLLGIAIVNVPWLGAPIPLSELLLDESLRSATPAADLACAALVEWLAEGKFYPQFSALFGFGAGVLLARGGALYARRIAVLFGFGLLHALFGWWGDILLDYALVGVLLGLVALLAPRGILAVAATSFAASCVLSYLFDGWLSGGGEDDPAHAAELAEMVRIYGSGSFAEITARRLDELLGFFAPYNRSYRANTLTMACLGLWMHRAGLLANLRDKRAALGRIAAALTVSGLLLALVPFLYIPAGDVLGLGWGALFLWLATAPAGSRLLVLAPLGRVAISAYLGQTLVFTLVFYGYGLGLYGQLGPLAGTALAAATWLVELALARAWMRHFALGPVEWLWRSLTHLRPMPMRRPPAQPM